MMTQDERWRKNYEEVEHASQEPRNHRLMEKRIMDQETRWLTRYNEVKTFIEKNKRNPSKHRIEEHDSLNWLKANRKRMNVGVLSEPRLGRFKELLVLCETYKRKNQYR